MNPTVSGANRFRNAASACPICGGWDATDRGHGKRCSGFATADGQYVNCSREELSGDIQANAGGLYGHRMRGPCKCGSTHGPGGAPEPEATYDYRDESGVLLSQVVRWPGKRFSQRRPTTNGGWEPRLGDARRVLYRLTDVMASTGTVYIVEGEKDVDILRRAGYVATCNLGGSGASSWRNVQDHARTILRGRTVVVVADLDGEQQQYAGQKHAQRVADSLRDIATVHGPKQCTRGKDAAAHLAAGGTLDELVDMVAPPAPSRAPEAASGTRPRLAVVRDDGPAWGDEEPPHVDHDERPEIVVGPDVHKMVDELEGLMGERDTGLYQRAHELVVAIANTAIGVGAGAPVIHGTTKPMMLERITRHVQFIRIERPTEKSVKLAEVSGSSPPRADRIRCAPPDTTVVAPFCARKHWPNVRTLVGITETPVLRPDGTVWQTPGYDALTGYLYSPSCDYPAVPELPTQADAIGALAQILDVFADFPYDSQESRIVPIAALLSIFGRPAIAGGVPAFLFDASVRGSGKTLQCDVVHLIATGRVAPHATWSQDDEEQRKVIGGFAELGPRAIVFDNVKGIFGGQFAEAALTSDVIQIRQLGSKNIVEYPWTTVTMVSGNNLQLTDDMLRRSLISRLETSLERPEDRPDTEFAHPDLLGWVRTERPRLVVAALTMLRAYACKGWPDSGARMASYQSWATIVAGTLAFARGGDVTRARPKLELAAADDVTYAATIATRLASAPVPSGSLKEILLALYPTLERGETRLPDLLEDLREAIEGVCPIRHGTMPDPRTLGKKLRPFVGRWFGSSKIVTSLDRTSTMKWATTTKPA